VTHALLLLLLLLLHSSNSRAGRDSEIFII